jgi:uncharacterized protein YgiM (DUF1202 family)
VRFAYSVVGTLVLGWATFPAAAEVGAVIRAGDLKATPFIDAASSGPIAANQQVTVINRKGGWVQVEANGKTGWVRMLNLRMQTGGSQAQGRSNVRDASLLRTNSSGRTVTTGIKGMGEEDLRKASIDPAQVAKLAALPVSPAEASANASASGLVEHPVGYLDSKQ